MQVAISILRILLFVARPRTSVVGNIPNSAIYRRMDQYPIAQSVSGVLILQIDAPIYFANASYLRERYAHRLLLRTYAPLCIPLLLEANGACSVFRISRWIDDEEERLTSKGGASSLQYVILDMGGK